MQTHYIIIVVFIMAKTRELYILTTCAYCNQPIYRWRFQLKKHPRHFCNSKCHGKWDSINKIANKANNWKGGKYSTIAQQLCNSKFRRLRKIILKLDNYKCVLCQSDIKLEAHHIIEKGKNSALIFDIENMITLCKKCHCLIRGREEDYIGYFNDIVEKRMNSGKPRTGNPEPSRVEPRKVQRLLEEDTSSLITSKSVLHESDDIV